MTVSLTTRNASLADLVNTLKTQQAAKVDVVAPAAALRVKDGHLVVSGVEAQLTADGVTVVDGRYLPTAACDGQIAAALGIPVKYLRRLRADAPDLYDANVNGWLRGKSIRGTDGAVRVERAADTRSFLLRAFRGDDGAPGVARALLSTRYAAIDNLDVLAAALDGIRAAGVEVNIDGADVTESGRMVVRVTAPSVQALAPALLRDYRSPFTGDRGDANPTVFAGFVIENSETGGSAFTITPRLVVQVCNNGMTIGRDAVRRTHLGERLDEGVVRWSKATQTATLELIKSRAADAVATFLDVDYMNRVITGLEAAAGHVLTGTAPEVIETVAVKLGYSEAERDGILDHFIRGGQVTTAGGVLQAVTSYSQTIEDADRAHELESSALAALEVAARA